MMEPTHGHPLEAIKTELGYLADVDVDLRRIWGVVDGSDLAAGDLPRVLAALMLSVKDYTALPGWTKKKVVVAVVHIAIDRTNQPAAAIETMKLLVPHLIDLFFSISKSGVKFKKGPRRSLTSKFRGVFSSQN